MTRSVPMVRTIASLRRAVARYRAGGQTVALVPTMGALHEGHLSLVRLAQKRADRTVVSIFVNPAQFAPSEDFSSYPRTFASDLAKLRQVRADLVWAPASTAEIYPPGFATDVVPKGPATVGLEDAFRPHFFAGVATVVAKLLLQCLPDVAVFGEKDFQQLRVVERMVADLDIPVRILGAATVRERDGLAMSSRNVYLSSAQRASAVLLHATLTECARDIRAGKRIAGAMRRARSTIARAGFDLDYCEARHALTLEPIKSLGEGRVRLLVAAKLGATRLIDNIAV